MKTTYRVLASSLTGVAMAGLIASPVLACTPKGSITKYVQDTTTNSQKVDANTDADALTVNPGDTLVYTIVINNDGGTTSNNQDAMVDTVLTDTLPSGVTPVNGSANITESIGTINEKSSVTKTYSVTVDSTDTNGQFITNKACYTGEATDHDKSQNQAGCDVAVVKVSVPTPAPVTTTTPTSTTTTPTTPTATTTADDSGSGSDTAVSAVTELPDTGAGNVIVPAFVVSLIGYAGYLLRLKRLTPAEAYSAQDERSK